MAGTTSRSGARSASIASINVTPMVDILLVLLVILMATASYVVLRSLQVNLPAADGEGQTEAPVGTVTIDAVGALSYNDEPVTEPGLQTRLQDLRSENESSVVVINADRLAQHGMVVRVLDMARTARLTHFSVQVVRGE